MISIGVLESPAPRIAPATTWFGQQNASMNTFIRRNMVPYRTTSGSWLKTATSRGAKRKRIPALANVMRSASRRATPVPFFARGRFPAPRF